MLSRMRELAVQAASGTYTTTDQAALDLEFGELMNEIDRIAANTEWNGAAILGGGDTTVTASGASTRDYNIQLGAETAQTMALTLNSWRTQVSRDTQMTAASGTNRDGVDPKVGEAQVVTFSAMTTNDVFTLAGITVTATATVTAANLENFFSDQTLSGAITGSLTGATVSGALTGYSTAEASNGTTTTFTSTGGRNDGKTLAATSTGTGANHASAAAVSVTGTEGVGAYGQGVLFFGTTPTRINVTSAANASQAIAEIDRAIDGAAAERAKYGSYMSRLQHASDNLQNVATNTAASRSQIADADYAAETTELARTQIISQASTAMLAQANQVKQTVLSLLQ